MSNFAINAVRIEAIFPIEKADRIEIAQVGLFRSVVGKGVYRAGQPVIYIPESAILPDPLIADLGLTLAGSGHNRVKAIHLRGELSQGIVCLPSALAGVDLEAAIAEDHDFAADLGISKWVPEVPANMSGEVFAAPRILSWVEIDNVKAHPGLFEPGEPVTASEKAHGSATLISLDLSAEDARDAFMVSSKGMGGKKLALVEADGNLYWRAVRLHDVEAKARRLAALLSALGDPVTRLGLFGEVYGAGVQDLTYGVASRNTPGLAIFDAFVETAGVPGRWIDQDDLCHLCGDVGLDMVPQLYAGPYDYDTLCAVAEGPTVLGAGAHIREGVVVRPAHERFSPDLGTRLILKFVSPAYLTRGNADATEYE